VFNRLIILYNLLYFNKYQNFINEVLLNKKRLNFYLVNFILLKIIFPLISQSYLDLYIYIYMTYKYILNEIKQV